MHAYESSGITGRDEQDNEQKSGEADGAEGLCHFVVFFFFLSLIKCFFLFIETWVILINGVVIYLYQNFVDFLCTRFITSSFRSHIGNPSSPIS